MQAHFPPFDSADWITPSVGVIEYGLPLNLINGAILSGELTVRTVAGEAIVRRAELKAMRLRLMSGRCEECQD